MTTPTHPWTDPADLLAELADIDALTADVFGDDVPLMDRVATLVADWDDRTALIDSGHGYIDNRGDVVRDTYYRRGLA